MSGYRWKSRSEPAFDIADGRFLYLQNGQVVTDQTYPILLWDSQRTLSRGNRGPYKADRGDRGGEFWTRRDTVKCKPHLVNIVRPYFGMKSYAGPLFARASSNGTSGFYSGYASESGRTALNVLGAIAIERSNPFRSQANSLTAFGEVFRDGLPKMLGVQALGRRSLKGAASEYLNFEFGIKPLLNDLRDITRVARNAESMMQQFHRDSGRIVRRTYTFPEEKTVSETKSTGTPSPVLDSTLFTKPLGTLFTTTTVTRQRWFEGAFSYVLPSRLLSYSDVIKDMSLTLDQVGGIVPTIEKVWELAPWSWLVDWFLNVQTVLSNWQTFAVDGLVLRYGYMMESTTDHRRYLLQGVRPYNLPAADLVQDFVSTTKVRYQASPYGFGVTFDGFSPRQLAILASIGITRS